MSDLQDWVGRQETRHDTLSSGPVQRMLALLDAPDELIKHGSKDAELPPLLHWLYFLDNTSQSQLGHDGHAKLGKFLPPVGQAPYSLTRRMWAGGRLQFEGNLQVGEDVTRVSTIQSIALKDGRSGPLCFVTVQHTITGNSSGALIVEDHDIVYKSAQGLKDAKQASDAVANSEPKWVHDGDNIRTIHPSTVMLFRYSALTFNGHRIHYDRDYCRDVEDYPGLVFHGPLAATLLASFACEKNRGMHLSRFAFKARAPLFDTHPFTLHSEGDNKYSARTPQGALAMEASAEF